MARRAQGEVFCGSGGGGLILLLAWCFVLRLGQSFIFNDALDVTIFSIPQSAEQYYFYSCLRTRYMDYRLFFL